MSGPANMAVPLGATFQVSKSTPPGFEVEGSKKR